jgi:ABC-type multidrug transport system ATPase subunit
MKSIELRHLYKTYRGRAVLKGINFTFAPGGRYALRGENGCGKTTLLNILSGYALPDSGEVVSQGRIAYLFQDDMIFSNLTVEENMRVKLYAGASRKSIIKENDITFVTNALETFGIGHLLKQITAFLSGGERQRLGLAQILLSKPDVLLLDEPTSKLDEKSKENFLHTISAIFQGTTLIMVTHDKDVIPDNFVTLRLESGELFYEK